jgi:cyclic-di-GMP phosphodiesterase, flagellum assembly factor TipF
MPARPAPVISRAPDPVVQKIEFEDEVEDEFEEALEAESAALPVADEEILIVEEEQVFAPREDAPAEEMVETVIAPRFDDNEMLEIVSQAIEAGRVDLYLQPTVTLPERRPRYFEALTRIRTRADELILPGSYLPVAESSGMMPLIDNVLLVKSVQTLRRLGSDSRIKGVFCNISVTTLLDPEFFPELVEFMEENTGLSESLIFEIGQPGILALNADELGALDTLGALGYGFSLDHVGDLDVDFASLRDRSFRYVKIDANTFLGGLAAKGSRFTAAELKRALDDFDLKLIIEKVENEDTVARLLDHGIDLAQGHLFAKPKPMSPALFREIEGADAV